MPSRRGLPATLAIASMAVMAGCGDANGVDVTDTPAPTSSVVASVESVPAGTASDAGLDFPEILAVEPSMGDDGRWSFAVTIASPYDTPQQYADGWRVVGPDGTVFGTHTLTHDHANEQPFTRRQTGVEIPDDIAEVTIEGRDLVNGFGGPTLTVALDRG